MIIYAEINKTAINNEFPPSPVLSTEQTQFLAVFPLLLFSPITDFDVMLTYQNIRNFPIFQTSTEVELHKVPHDAHLGPRDYSSDICRLK